jgi:hypothetical protein
LYWRLSFGSHFFAFSIHLHHPFKKKKRSALLFRNKGILFVLALHHRKLTTMQRPRRKKRRRSDGDDEEESPTKKALAWCQEARLTWLNATSLQDLETVETLYRRALNAKRGSDDRQRQQQFAALGPSDYRKAGERLSLLYIQSGRAYKAKPGLEYLNFTCRLSERILNYPTGQTNHNKKILRHPKPPCCVVDDFLSERQLQYLQDIFCDPDADYWTDHSYSVEPPSPYFSYVVRIERHDSFLQSLIRQILTTLHTDSKHRFLQRLRDAKFVELWAHNRPHASGHQLHFDSDNEGKDGVRNPIISTILYLNPRQVGGPSLITDQTLQSLSLSHTQGWLAHGKPRRMVAFDGRVLHGVIPGKGVGHTRRVTLMLAFWKDIQLRPSDTPGAARPWPMESSNKPLPSWAAKLDANLDHDGSPINGPHSWQDPLSIGAVYQDLDGRKLTKTGTDAMPEYEQVFQGF